MYKETENWGRSLVVNMWNITNHVLYTMISVIIFYSTGCSTLRSGLLGDNMRSSYSERLDFDSPLTFKLKDPPILLQDKIDTALYLFKKGQYGKACDLFLQSMDMIEDPKHPLSRECGKAAAVSALMNGDREKFKRIMTSLDYSFSTLERFTYNDNVYKELKILASELR